MAGTTFAIGDIHGCANELEELLERLPLKADSTVVFLGDYIDRGPDSKRVIDIILDLKKKCNVVALKGNHEEMMLDFLQHPESPGAALFILNGGSATLASYSTEPGRFEIPPEHIEFLENLELYYETDKYFFVHAGVPEIELSELDKEKHKGQLLWIRQPFLSSDHNWGKVIVHGHTPRSEIENRGNRIGLDTGCVYGNFLSALDFTSGDIYTAPQNRPVEHVYLKDENENRIARRFEGAIKVTLEEPIPGVEFETLNYNEFGLLIRQNDLAFPHISKGQMVKGVIGEREEAKVEFEGEVVRHDYDEDSRPMFGIKIISLKRQNDEVES